MITQIQEMSMRFMGTADSLKLSSIAVGLDFLAWGMVIMGMTKDQSGILAGFAGLGIIVLTLGVGIVTLPLAILDITRKPTRVQGLSAFGLSLLVLGWNIFVFSHWDL